MMDKKKVREAIYCMKSFADDTVCEECDNYDGCDHTMVADNAKTAIEALEKQLPKKLVEHHYEEEGEELYIKMTCPNGCKFQPSRSSKYCRECGQKLDWRK